jgi:hypothetical protein
MDSHAKVRRMNGRLSRRPAYDAQAGDDARPGQTHVVAGIPADEAGLTVYRGPDWDVQGLRWEAQREQLHEYQQLWLTLDNGWSSLAVLGTASGASEQEVGLNLAVIGFDAGHHPVALLDATGVRLSQTERLIERVQLLCKNGARVIVVVEPLQDNPAGFALTQALDEIVMVVRPGLSKYAAIERTIELVGSANIRGIVSRPAESKRDAEARSGSTQTNENA